VIEGRGELSALLDRLANGSATQPPRLPEAVWINKPSTQRSRLGNFLADVPHSG
jgi:hypothetical protein